MSQLKQKMTEQAPKEQLQEDKNLELLRNSELGVILEEVYLEAMRLDPRLAEVEILALPNEDPGLARAQAAWASENGRHQVQIRLNNLETALEKTDQALAAIPGARELFAEKLGIAPESMTPQMLYVFGLGHELGHISEYMDNEKDPDALRERTKKEKAALPIGNATVSAILVAGTPANTLVRDNWEAISQAYNLQNMEDLLGLQHSAYRSMTSEKNADMFAEKIFIDQPTLVDQMTGPNLEDYRSMPLAA